MGWILVILFYFVGIPVSIFCIAYHNAHAVRASDEIPIEVSLLSWIVIVVLITDFIIDTCIYKFYDWIYNKLKE